MTANSEEVQKEYFSMEETLWRLTPHKDTGGMDLSFLSICYKTLQHGHPHNVVLAMEPSLHPHADLYHCQEHYPVTRRMTLTHDNYIANG